MVVIAVAGSRVSVAVRQHGMQVLVAGQAAAQLIGVVAQAEAVAAVEAEVVAGVGAVAKWAE